MCLQSSQGYLTPSSILIICCFRSYPLGAVYLHLFQRYLNPSCLLSILILRAIGVVAVCSHLSHGYLMLSHSWLYLKCGLRRPSNGAVKLHWMVYFWTYAHPLYCPSDLRARGFNSCGRSDAL